MSDNLEYTYPSEEMVQNATITIAAGTPATGYGVDKLANGNPADPFKVDSTTFRIVLDFGADVAPKLAVIIHHNFAPGLSGVKLQGNASDSWGSPSFSRTFDAASYFNDEFPVNLSTDLRSASPSYRYWSLVVTSANTVNCSIGEFLMYSDVHALEGSLTLSMDPQEEEDHPLIEHQTDADVSLMYILGYKRRIARGGLIQTDENAALIRDWNRATYGRGNPFVVLMQDTEATGEEPWYVRFAQSVLVRKFTYGDKASVFDVALTEVSRGLKPTPSAV